MSEEFAFVTGVSRGLGRALAFELAQRHINLLLVSSNPEVEKLKDELVSQFSIQAHSFVADMTNADEVMALTESINAQYKVFMLINNSGIGGSCAFEKADSTYIQRILQLNVMATSLMTKGLIDNLLSQPKSYLLNVASMAAVTPIAFKTVYPASKAFVVDFSLALRQEYRGTPLSVSVALPGAMATNPDATARIQRQGFFGKLTLASVEQVAAKCVRQLLRGKRLILINPIAYYASMLIPSALRTKLISRVVKREVQ